MQVKHSEFIEAVTPLLALSGVDPMGVYVDVTIRPSGKDDVLTEVTFLRAEDPGDGTEPFVHGDKPDPEFGVLAWPLTVEVV